ncbi:alpha/beta hydrolase fold domain-containing protein [Salmonella enterica]
MRDIALATDFANLLAVKNLFMVGRREAENDHGRLRIERWISSFAQPVSCETHYKNGVRSFYPTKQSDAQAIFYLHGGGLVYYSTAIFAPFLSQLCQATGRIIHAFDYPKAPETPMQECVDVLEARLAQWLVDSPWPTLVGDSVGGLLALYFAGVRFSQSFSDLHLIYPVVADHHGFASFQEFGEGYLLDAQMLRGFAAHWHPWCREQAFDPLGEAFNYRALPACTVHTAGYDVLKDEGLAFVRRVSEKGRLFEHYHHPAMPHDFCLYAGKLPSALRATALIADVLTTRTK